MTVANSGKILLVATALAAAGCQGASAGKGMNHASTAANAASKAALISRAQGVIVDDDRRTAIAALETAVRAAPDDAEARVRLAQAYFVAGRFRAAAEAYQDALAIRPGDDLRLKRALALLARGDRTYAVAELDRIASSWDAGLAYALAGETRRGVELLTIAARDPNAGARTRQNLALAHALDGQWAKARAVAAQDLDPATLDTRIREWAELASTGDVAVQTTHLLAVAPAALDTGRPVALAYIAPDSRVQLADGRVPAAAPDVVTVTALSRAQAPEARPLLRHADERRAASGQWAVQLGAYATADLLEANWQRIARGGGAALGGVEALRIEASVGDRRVHRLAVGGFGNRADAAQLCRTLRSKGRDCFVRNITGETPVQLARTAEPDRA